MALPSLVLDLVIEWLKLLDPAFHLPLWFSEGQQPLECSVVGADGKGQPTELVVGLPYHCYHCEQLSLRHTVSALCFLRDRLK